ncbi:MAG: sporulation protein YqfC [Syntrophomonadaceae bacterium]|nr:sporulation protein YqfC [Syntrophomonadaceae bacterium]
MDKKREAIKVMADLLEIPRDLVLDLPKLTIIGRNEIHLENHRGIIEYSLNRVRINLSRGYLELEGDAFEIKALLSDEVYIIGDIRSIKYLD